MAIKVLRTINTQSTLAVLSRLLTRKTACVISLENSCSPGNDKVLLAFIWCCINMWKILLACLKNCTWFHTE